RNVPTFSTHNGYNQRARLRGRHTQARPRWPVSAWRLPDLPLDCSRRAVRPDFGVPTAPLRRSRRIAPVGSLRQQAREYETADPAAELPPLEEAPGRLSAAVYITNFLAVTLPFLGLAAAIFFLWDFGFSWVELGLLLGMYALTALGITVGFHRLFTHRSFQTYP